MRCTCLRDSFPAAPSPARPNSAPCKIIEQLEPHRRGIYCGAIGYVGFDGNMDSNIVIRTLVYSDKEIRCMVGAALWRIPRLRRNIRETLDKRSGDAKIVTAIWRKMIRVAQPSIFMDNSRPYSVFRARTTAAPNFSKEEKMKADIHPKYEEIAVNCSCGNAFKTNSTLGKPLHVKFARNVIRSTPVRRRLWTLLAGIEKFNRNTASRSKSCRVMVLATGNN